MAMIIDVNQFMVEDSNIVQIGCPWSIILALWRSRAT